MVKKFLFLTSLFLFFLLAENQAFAADPHLFLSPASNSYSQSFDLEVRVDTGGQAAGGVDVLLEFPKSILSAQKITKGTAFSEVFSSIKNDEGKIVLGAYFPQSEAESSYNGNNGLVATISFNPLGTGSANINFVCTPNSTADSNIVAKTSSKDIIVCSANINGSYNLTSQNTQPTNTPTPTTSATGSATPTLTPTSTPKGVISTSTPSATPTVPVTGSTIQTFSLLGLGVFILLTGLALAF